MRCKRNGVKLMGILDWNYHESLYLKFDLIFKRLMDLMEKKGLNFFEKMKKSKSSQDFQLIFSNIRLKFDSEKEKLITYITFLKNIDQLFADKTITIDFLKVNLIGYIHKILISLNYLTYELWSYINCDVETFDLNLFFNNRWLKNFNFLETLRERTGNSRELDLDLVLLIRNSVEHISNLNNDISLYAHKKIYDNDLKYAPVYFVFEHYWWSDNENIETFAIEKTFDNEGKMLEKPILLYSKPITYFVDDLLPNVLNQINLFIDKIYKENV
jgi:hypothetical protein